MPLLARLFLSPSTPVLLPPLPRRVVLPLPRLLLPVVRHLPLVVARLRLVLRRVLLHRLVLLVAAVPVALPLLHPLPPVLLVLLTLDTTGSVFGFGGCDCGVWVPFLL